MVERVHIRRNPFRFRISKPGKSVDSADLIHLDVRWLNETGAPIDVTGNEIVITDAKPAIIAEADVSVVGGKLEMRLHSDKAKLLGQGRTNRFRLERRVPGEACPKMSRDIWIRVD